MLTFARRLGLSFVVVVVCAAYNERSEGNSPHYKVSTMNLEDEKGCRYVEVRVDHGAKEFWDVSTVQSKGTIITEIIPRRCDTGDVGIKTVHGGGSGVGGGDGLGDCDGDCDILGLTTGSSGKPAAKTKFGNNKCPSPRQTCPSQAALKSLDYELLPSIGFYKIHKYSLKWEEAKKKCEEEQTHLVVAKSTAHVLSLIDLINRKGNRGYYWFGFHDRDKEGHYVTIFNETVESTGYNTWMIGEPTGGVGENCGLFFYNAQGQYGLGDFDCNSGAWFICEREDT